MRATLKIILPLIGDVVPGNVFFDAWEEIVQRRGRGGTTHSPSAN
jgi:hypothetical protein